jgi:CheY-like chemotaxis protein
LWFLSIAFRWKSRVKDLSESPLKGLRVFLLEDEFLIAMDVEMMCLDHGASEVIIRHQLKEGEDEPLPDFDVAVVDLVLAGQSTIPFADRLARLGKPFIFASGYADSVDVARFPSVPIVTKPYAGSELIEAIASAVRSRNGAG